MATSTPRRGKGREPKADSLFPSQVLAENLNRAKGARGLSQGDVAERMAALGHGWVRQTVGEVERSGRAVTVDELLGLAATLAVSVVGLLNPEMTHGLHPPRIDLGLREYAPPFSDVALLISAEPSRSAARPFDWPHAQVIWSEDNEPVSYSTGNMTVTHNDDVPREPRDEEQPHRPEEE